MCVCICVKFFTSGCAFVVVVVVKNELEIQAPDQMIQDLARSTDANTELNGFHETAVTAAALRINKPPDLGR